VLCKNANLEVDMEAVIKMTALFIDDDCDDVEFLTASLKKTGRFEHIHCFQNGPEALAFMDDPRKYTQCDSHGPETARHGGYRPT
jgi:hypothetical protein